MIFDVSADDAIEEMNVEADDSGQQLTHEILRADALMHKKLVSILFARLCQWCVQYIELCKICSGTDQNVCNLSCQLLQKHRSFQDHLLRLLNSFNFDKACLNMEVDCTHVREHAQQTILDNVAGDAQEVQDTEVDNPFAWPESFSKDSVDGEILSNLMLVLKSLQSDSVQHHALDLEDHQLSKQDICQLLTACLDRYAEGSIFSLHSLDDHGENSVQCQLSSYKSEFEHRIPHLDLPVKWMFDDLYDRIEDGRQTCICCLIRDGNFILIGTKLVLVLSGQRKIHVRVTDVQPFSNLSQVSEEVLSQHAFDGNMNSFQAKLQEDLSTLYSQQVTAKTPVVAIHFQVCSACANVYQRSHSPCANIIALLDEIVGLPRNQLPCIQQDRVVSLVQKCHEIDQCYVSPTEKQAIMDRYHARVGTDLKLVSCASCGVRGLESDSEHGFGQMELHNGFPFEKDFDTDRCHLPPVFSYVLYPLNTNVMSHPKILSEDQVKAMYQRLCVDKEDVLPAIIQSVPDNDKDRVRKLFESLPRKPRPYKT